MYDYFEIQSRIGISKHMGGMEATRELLNLCEVDDSDYVLIAGSGNGVSAIRIHQMTGCRVLGVDISPNMVERSREKLDTHEEGLEFAVGDVENLKFPNDIFDVVISESVTGFTDKTKSISEYYRVLKNRGRIGLNEVTWLAKPSPEIDEYCRRVLGLKPETREGWLSLLEKAGFSDFTISIHIMNQWKQIIGDLELQSMDFSRIWGRFIQLYLKEREYRKSVHHIAREALHIPRDFNQYFGYGLYMGRK